MTKLLINEYPLILLPSLVKKVGMSKAIVLQQVQYWLSMPSAHEKEGRMWVYNTYEEWQKQFPFWAESTIGDLFRSMEKDGLLISKQFNTKNFDNTKWYTINYDHDNLSSTPVSIQASAIADVQGSHKTETTTETTEENIEEYFNNRPERLVNKGETKGKRMTKEELAAASLGIGEKNKLEGIPPAHQDLLRPFCEFYRYPFKDEVKSWIAQADVWLGRKYTSRDVVNACKYVVENEGWQVYQPASILKAFGKKLKKETIIREEPKKRY